MVVEYGSSLGINWLTWRGANFNVKGSNCKLGFCGDGGKYIQNGEWQGTSYLIDSSDQKIAQTHNNQYYSDTYTSTDDNEVDSLLLTKLPNYQSTLNIRFVNSSEVRVYEAKVKMYDGIDLDNPPIAVRAKIAEVVHPGRSQRATSLHTTEWQSAGSGQWFTLSRSPGRNGQYSGRWGFKKDTIHDWYLAISVSPKEEDIVKRDFGSLYFYIEYI